jgi:hypothetical protein
MPEQPGWRFCIKCSAMFWDGWSGKGACPADGGGHQALGFVFKLPHDVPPSATAQDKWRFCDQCYAMFWEHPQNMGHCPRGGAHQVKDSYMFALPHTGVSRPATLHMWVDGLRCHSETPGLGIHDSDEPFVLVAVIDLARGNVVGIPPTDVVLYGPLDDVEDQENQSFPFRPFWVAPFAPSSALFLTAILEHDNVSPDLTRTSAGGGAAGRRGSHRRRPTGADRVRGAQHDRRGRGASFEPGCRQPPGRPARRAGVLAVPSCGGDVRRHPPADPAVQRVRQLLRPLSDASQLIRIQGARE